MVSESCKAYPSESLLGLSNHPLSDRYRTTHNIYFHAQVGSLKMRACVGDPTSTRDQDISSFISGCKPHLIRQFYEVELGLMFTS